MDSRPGYLRKLLRERAPLIVPGAPNALTARIVADCGFPAVYVSGAGIANWYLGVPDLGLTNLGEVVQHCAAVCAAVEVPVIADADTGYGNALNVSRTVRELERAGVAAIQIEDQVDPKRCGHFEGKEVIPVNEMEGKIAAAVDSRRDPDLMIIARTDARAIEGLEAAIERARRYRDAGADAIFVEAPTGEDELRIIGREVPGPLVANMVEGGKTPILDRDRLGDLGFSIVLYANLAPRAAMRAMSESLRRLAADGTSSAVIGRIASTDERNRLTGMAVWRDLDRRYGSRSPA